ncbi:MAG: DUF541 domain-containing protein [Actinomycetales bacterium]|nr:DUF541 domain-containing protein [Actinomycetales bacterium]
MRARIAAAGLAVVMVALLSACSPSTVVNQSPDAARTVSVSATGQADAKPDAAHASLTVEVTDPSSAQKAQSDAAVATTAVLDALTAAGVADADVATQGVSVSPQYNYTDAGQQLVGYRASQTIDVTLRDLTTAGSTLDSVVAAGGNAVRVDSFSTFVVDPTKAAQAARAQAVQIAQAQAAQYAQLLGFTLGEVMTVSESTSTVGPPPIAYSEDAAATANKVPTPIEAGTTQISVTLNISWSIS